MVGDINSLNLLVCHTVSILETPIWVLLQTGAQWLSGRVLDLRPRGHGFEPHQSHFVVILSKAH